MATREQIILEGVNKTDKAFRGVDKNIKGLNTGFSTLQKTLIGVGASLATGAFAKSIITTSMRFEDLRTSLKSVTGSAQEGADAFAFITKFSTQTQFSVEDLSTAFIKLKASGIEPTKELLTTFTDTAAITTDQIGTLEAITDLFARTVSGGLGLEELNRLADRGVPVFRILEEQLGLTRLQISEFGKTAEGAAKITEAFSKGIQEEFGGATQNVLDNLSTKVSNLGIAANNAKDQIGSAGLTGALGDVVETMTNAIIKNEEFNKTLGKALGTVVGKFNDALLVMGQNTDKVAIAMGAVAGPAIGGALILTLNGIRGAFIALTGAMMRNPFGLILVAVSSLIGALSMQNGLGRTLAQVGAVFDHLGEIIGKFRNFIADKVAMSVDFVKEKFYNFVDSLIDAHNFIARIIPGMQEFDKEARGLAVTIGGPFGDAYDYASEKAGSLLEKLKETDAYQTAIGFGVDLGQVITDAGNDYDAAMKKIVEANKMLEGAMAHKDPIMIIAENNKKEIEANKIKNEQLAEANKIKNEQLAEAEAKAAKKRLFIARALTQQKLEFHRLEAEGVAKFEERMRKKELFIAEQNHKRKMEFHRLESEGVKKFNEENISYLQAYTEGFKGQIGEQMSVLDQLKEAGANAFNGMVDTLTNFVMTGKFKFKDFANMVIRDLIRIAVQAAATFAIKKALAMFGGPIGGFLGGFLADGGPAQAGKPYIVGEEGPELFIPNSSGKVIPNDEMTSTGTSSRPVQVNFTVNAIDSQSFTDTLQTQKDTIVGIINEAVIEQGRPAIA